MIKPIAYTSLRDYTYIIPTRVAFFLPIESSCHAQLLGWIVGWISLTSPTRSLFSTEQFFFNFELIFPLAHNNAAFFC